MRLHQNNVTPNAVQYFSSGLDQKARAQDRSAKDYKGENKKLEDISLNRGKVCDTSQNNSVCGVLTFAM